VTTVPCWARVDGPLAPYVGGFRAELGRLGYTPLTTATHVRLMAHLDRWLSREGLDVSALTPATVEAYFAERRAGGYVNERTARALEPLTEYLRRLGALPDQQASTLATPVERLLARYREYLASERGLAPATVALNVRLVRPFLLERANTAGEHLGLEGLTAGEVAEFVVGQCRRRPRSAQRIVTSLRSLLRFLHVTGVLGQPLAAAVPSVAGWKLAGLPQALDAGQVAALLDSCAQQRRATGLRDLAILTLLFRMGLRAGEVAALGLDDIDWRLGEITVRGKGNRCDRMPLPADVGAALVAYLRDGRPAAARGRTVFVRAQAPYSALTTAAVTTVVACAGVRAGVGPVHAHRLRHSAATAMLRSGGSLREIGQALRHVRLLTTAIYAKVDIEALRALARPWPGEAS
jgi:integrase/recombinase XerD